MRFIYHNQTAKVMNRNYTGYTNIHVGGSFIAEKGVTEIKMTPVQVIDSSKNKVAQCLEYLSGFIGGYSMHNGDDSIGEWTDEISKKANVYYTISEDLVVRPFVITPYNDLKCLPIGGCLYLVVINNKLYEAFPEEKDIIYDNIEEALSDCKAKIKYLKKKNGYK